MSNKSRKACLCIGGLSRTAIVLLSGALVFCCYFIERMWAMQVAASAPKLLASGSTPECSTSLLLRVIATIQEAYLHWNFYFVKFQDSLNLEFVFNRAASSF